jgi:uncharacterized protein (DUF305 family)
MRLLILAPASILLAACGSNVPPMPEEERRATHAAPGTQRPAPTGNQDRDFARMMIAHHQGAIDMARTQLARGSDPGLRKLAGEIIADQEREIRMLNAYLEANGGR